MKLLLAIWRFVHALGIALDYGSAMTLWLRVEAPMTISSHCGLALRRGETGFLAVLGSVLNFIDWPARKRGSTHCDEAIAADMQRAAKAYAELQR